ncbi:MAG: 7-carboxy-7-deazaguanine synthase QueE [Bacteroidales bacterium]|nr:7-carboxy-7-deazaguanine synthase QueE [Bacteroidales bacterium]
MTQQELLKSGRLLPVMEEFLSLQGEGYHTGEATWFIRIGGCDVGCDWCDVKESWNADLFPPVKTDIVVEKALQSKVNAVIVTGGEPLLYNLNYLCDQLKSLEPQGIKQSTFVKTFLETSGSQPLSGRWDWICLSPKQEWAPREEFYGFSDELKVIIHQEEDFNWAEKQAERMRPAAHRFLQPEWSQRNRMLPLIIRYIESNPSWRLSLQTHKYIGIP